VLPPQEWHFSSTTVRFLLPSTHDESLVSGPNAVKFLAPGDTYNDDQTQQ
jgi:hypothetical protein